ncbi:MULTISPECIES: DUF3592 domain-containing protein [unclassified Lentimonas]|uniref:DUF3592 domain-containing protein n=1 Tax=unclassified Lentimonas TaxID=2630993 RepID=UPI001327D247|nr:MULTISPECIES: DUF3592 domain-containing protein [unclassified Lentimonas]CAA6696796.1 Unannotated [Lentimonas sp. CC19]CAA6697410.1 Unannotated [Lentimonas sp. CC10]CAA7071339.1 Unannotated [Lentimonas sp. CC11]
MKISRKKRSSNANGKMGKGVGLLFGCAFFGMGALFCWMMGLSPLLKSLDSKDWVEVSCVIHSSEVESHRGSDSTTYSVEISFDYTVSGQPYQSDTYNFSNASSSGRGDKAEVVARYPVGSAHSCWVNPEDPSEAVLSRDIPGSVYFIIPFSSVFMIIGAFFLLGTAGLLPKKWGFSFNSRHKRVTTEAAGTQQLKSSSSGIGKVIAVTFAACFWNGIVSVFLFQLIKSYQGGRPDWFLTIFLIPFVLIGIGLIFGIFHSLLALANPKIELTLSESSPALGDKVQLEWSATKPLTKVRNLKIALQGEEAATYRRGTNSVTDKSTFYRDLLLELDQPAAQQRGTLELTIPTDSMHSFDSSNNKIVWQISVDGEIPRFPDIKNTYPITVRPIPLS